MEDFWVTFETGRKACVTADNEQAAIELASKLSGRKATSAKTLPYPAEPRLNKVDQGGYGPCPSFCFKPDQCAGYSACPQGYSCTE